MMRTTIYILVFLLPFLLGCPSKPSNNSESHVSSEITEESQQRSNEIFNQSMLTLNTLEEHPCLEGQRDAELLRQIVSRLDKWIRTFPADPLWKKDETIIEMENSLRSSVTKVQKAAAFLHRLQGREFVDSEDNSTDAIAALASVLSDEEKALPLADVQKQLTVLLQEIDGDLKNLTPIVRVPFEQVSPPFGEMGKKFATFGTLSGISDTDRQAFSEQMQLEPLAQFALGLSRYADALKIEPLDFHVTDGDYLKQSVWLRNVSNWARGESQSDLERVQALFDWTIRNIDLRSDLIPVRERKLPDGKIEREFGIAPRQQPWQTLLLGHGSQWDRAWLFIELLRQQRIDAAVLGVTPPEKNEPTPWAVGVLLENEIYIFLPGLGVPLPAKDGISLGENGELVFNKIATLANLAAEPEIISQFEGIKKHVPFDPALLKSSTAFLLATPFSTAQRMCILEKELLGKDQKMVLYISYPDQAKRFSEIPNVTEIRHWDRPFEAEFEVRVNPYALMPQFQLFFIPGRSELSTPLWTGRVLHLKGNKSGTDSAVTQLMEARIPERRLQEMRGTPDLVAMLQMAKLNASYWLGLIAFEDGNLPLAKSNFEDKSVLAGVGSPWQGGIQYNLGRIAERQKEYDSAVAAYSRFLSTASAAGNQLRAEMLKFLLSK